MRAACALVSVRWIAQFQTLPLEMPPPWGRQPDFCNGQVSQSLDPTEGWARFGIVGTMLVVYTMLVRSLCTCICPSVSINSDFSVENSARRGTRTAAQRAQFSLTGCPTAHKFPKPPAYVCA